MSQPAHANDVLFIFVDGEKFEPGINPITPNQIINDATGLDSSTHYLVKIHGSTRTLYRDAGDTPIHVEKAERFQVVSTGPTTVS